MRLLDHNLMSVALRMFLALAFLAPSALLSTPAQADMEVILQIDAGPQVLVVDNPVDFVGGSFNGTFGTFTVNFLGAASINGTTSQLLESTTNVMNTDALNTHTHSTYF